MRRAASLAALASLGALGLVLALALAGAPAAGAGGEATVSAGTLAAEPPPTETEPTPTETEPTPTETQPTPTETEPSPPPPSKPRPKPKPAPATIAAGVTVGKVLVGGLTALEAKQLLRKRFLRPFVLIVSENRRLRVSPKKLGGTSHLDEAVRRARHAREGAVLPLKVTVVRAKLDRWVRKQGRALARAPVDSRLVLRGVTPVVTRSVPGRRLREVVVERALFLALKTHIRDPMRLPFAERRPATTERSFPQVIVIRREGNWLDFWVGLHRKRSFRVATGQSSFPTPLGSYEVTTKWRNPWWYPPPSDWAQGEDPVPPGPGNPLGTRWMGISAPYVGIHGTPDAASIGYSASHGCIRMHIPDAEWLFDRVEIGTPVFIVAK